MINTIKDIATTVTPALMPALVLEVPGSGVSVSGRRTSAGCVAAHYGIRVPAFPTQDALTGVRAWSPPA